MRAYRADDNTFSDYSNVATVMVPCVLILPTLNLSVSYSGFPSRLLSPTISLWWLDTASDETSYHFERYLFTEGTWAELAVLDANSTVYEDTTLPTPGRCQELVLRCRIRIYRASDDAFSDYSPIVEARIPGWGLLWGGMPNNRPAANLRRMMRRGTKLMS